MKSLNICWIAIACILVGCNSHPTQKLMPEPSPPPSYPPRQDVPIDQSLHESAKREVLAALRSNDALERANAVEAAQDGLAAEGAPQIIAALDDPASAVRFSAAMATGRLQLADARAKLLTLAEDKDPSVRV